MRAPNRPTVPSHTPKRTVGQRSKMASGDPTLDEIRARRLAELQAQYGGGVRSRIHKYVIREEQCL